MLEPLQVPLKKACEILGVSRSGFYRLMKNQPNFPKPLKMSDSRQASVYFDYQQLKQWHLQRLEGENG